MLNKKYCERIANCYSKIVELESNLETIGKLKYITDIQGWGSAGYTVNIPIPAEVEGDIVSAVKDMFIAQIKFLEEELEKLQ